MSDSLKLRSVKRKRIPSEEEQHPTQEDEGATLELLVSSRKSDQHQQLSTESTSSMFDPMNFKEGSVEFSTESASSMFDPMNFSKRSEEVTGRRQVSTESESSMFDPMNFPKGSEEVTKLRQFSTQSASSMFNPMNFPKGSEEVTKLRQVSTQSASSMFNPMNFPKGNQEDSSASPKRPKRMKKMAETTDSSGMSLASDTSKHTPVNFPIEPKRTPVPVCCVCKEKFEDDPVYLTCRHVVCTRCVKTGMETETVEEQSQTTEVYFCSECGTLQAATTNQPALQTSNRLFLDMVKKLKKEMLNKFSKTSEGNGDERRPLKHIYTSLSINCGNRDQPQDDYFTTLSLQQQQGSPVKEVQFNNLFVTSPTKTHRMVLTNGMAGIGKSFFVQKFVVDWAENISNKDIQLVFCLSFRELNLTKEDMSLLQLLKMFHPAVSDLNPQNLDFVNVIVILDGFDESRFQLDFSDTQKVTSVQETASVPRLLINLIKGNLLPKAQLWITSRPAASYQFPGEFVHVVTDIQGFNDQQKEEYFKKRFNKKADMAKMVISYIQSSLTLDVLCQIPIFCWMSSVLLEELFGGEEQTEAPQTLTEMMGAFMFVQTKRSSKKYDQNPEKERTKLFKAKKELLFKLGKLAFIHLLNNSLIFYEEDLQQCGLDPNEAAVNSGFFNSVLREEQLFLQQKVFDFVHLTVQEFFAALYVYDCFTNNKLWTPELSTFLGLDPSDASSRPPVFDLLKVTVDKVLERNSGHLNFFQRFLLGLVVESNHKFIYGLLVPVKSGEETVRKMLSHLRAIRRKTISPDACINLFQTMVEMGDTKISEEIQEYLKSEDKEGVMLTPLQCSALAFTIQASKSVFEELDLKSYNTSEEGRRRLISAVRSSKKANLSDCKLSEALLKPLSLALSFPHSSLKDLDLTNSDLGDSGVELLCEGLKSSVCKLRVLRLSGCLVTESGCSSLVSALKLNPFHLKELDLSYNHLGTSGETALTDLQKEPQSNLSQLLLNVSHSGSHRIVPGLKKYRCDLSWDTQQAQAGVQFSADHRGVSCSVEGPDRVLVWGGQELSGRCYWEIIGSAPLNFGVMYQSRELRETEFKLGQNEKSWSFVCSEEGCYIFHNNKSFPPASTYCSRSSRLAVYLDHPAGVLSFYKVSTDSRTCLYTFREKFNKDLFPVAELQANSSVNFYREPPGPEERKT